jgi:hypothetical protein
MTANATAITLFLLYLGLTVLVGLWQARSIKSAQDFAMTKMSVWRAATFLAGFTMGGASTYGLAGDTVKYGFTYLVWFPVSIMTAGGLRGCCSPGLTTGCRASPCPLFSGNDLTDASEWRPVSAR